MADDCGDVVFLEEPDCGDTGCAGLQAGLGVLQGYSSQREYRDCCTTGLAESFQASGECIFLFEDGREDGEGGLVCGGFGYFLWGVTGDGDEGSLWREFTGRSACVTIGYATSPRGSNFLRGDI